MTGILNAIVAIYIYTLVPEFLLRFIDWILINTLYRIRTSGLENIPETGPALLVCNHVSFMDPLIVLGSIRRQAMPHEQVFRQILAGDRDRPEHPQAHGGQQHAEDCRTRPARRAE